MAAAAPSKPKAATSSAASAEKNEQTEQRRLLGVLQHNYGASLQPEWLAAATVEVDTTLEDVLGMYDKVGWPVSTSAEYGIQPYLIIRGRQDSKPGLRDKFGIFFLTNYDLDKIVLAGKEHDSTHIVEGCVFGEAKQGELSTDVASATQENMDIGWHAVGQDTEFGHITFEFDGPPKITFGHKTPPNTNSQMRIWVMMPNEKVIELETLAGKRKPEDIGDVGEPPLKFQKVEPKPPKRGTLITVGAPGTVVPPASVVQPVQPVPAVPPGGSGGGGGFTSGGGGGNVGGGAPVPLPPAPVGQEMVGVEALRLLNDATKLREAQEATLKDLKKAERHTKKSIDRNTVDLVQLRTLIQNMEAEQEAAQKLLNSLETPPAPKSPSPSSQEEETQQTIQLPPWKVTAITAAANNVTRLSDQLATLELGKEDIATKMDTLQVDLVSLSTQVTAKERLVREAILAETQAQKTYTEVVDRAKAAAAASAAATAAATAAAAAATAAAAAATAVPPHPLPSNPPPPLPQPIPPPVLLTREEMLQRKKDNNARAKRKLQQDEQGITPHEFTDQRKLEIYVHFIAAYIVCDAMYYALIDEPATTAGLKAQLQAPGVYQYRRKFSLSLSELRVLDVCYSYLVRTPSAQPKMVTFLEESLPDVLFPRAVFDTFASIERKKAGVTEWPHLFDVGPIDDGFLKALSGADASEVVMNYLVGQHKSPAWKTEFDRFVSSGLEEAGLIPLQIIQPYESLEPSPPWRYMFLWIGAMTQCAYAVQCGIVSPVADIPYLTTDWIAIFMTDQDPSLATAFTAAITLGQDKKPLPVAASAATAAMMSHALLAAVGVHGPERVAHGLLTSVGVANPSSSLVHAVVANARHVSAAASGALPTEASPYHAVLDRVLPTSSALTTGVQLGSAAEHTRRTLSAMQPPEGFEEMSLGTSARELAHAIVYAAHVTSEGDMAKHASGTAGDFSYTDLLRMKPPHMECVNSDIPSDPEFAIKMRQLALHLIQAHEEGGQVRVDSRPAAEVLGQLDPSERRSRSAKARKARRVRKFDGSMGDLVPRMVHRMRRYGLLVPEKRVKRHAARCVFSTETLPLPAKGTGAYAPVRILPTRKTARRQNSSWIDADDECSEINIAGGEEFSSGSSTSVSFSGSGGEGEFCGAEFSSSSNSSSSTSSSNRRGGGARKAERYRFESLRERATQEQELDSMEWRPASSIASAFGYSPAPDLEENVVADTIKKQWVCKNVGGRFSAHGSTTQGVPRLLRNVVTSWLPKMMLDHIQHCGKGSKLMVKVGEADRGRLVYERTALSVAVSEMITVDVLVDVDMSEKWRAERCMLTGRSGASVCMVMSAARARIGASGAVEIKVDSHRIAVHVSVCGFLLALYGLRLYFVASLFAANKIGRVTRRRLKRESTIYTAVASAALGSTVV